MRAARGNIIKILFQDDLLCKTNALSMIVEAFIRQKGAGYYVVRAKPRMALQ